MRSTLIRSNSRIDAFVWFLRSTHLVLLLSLGTSLGLNLLLARRVRQLGGSLAEQYQNVQLQVGTLVPPIVAKELDGKSTTIAYAGSNRLTILYFFAPECRWCDRNMDNLRALLKAEGEDRRFIGLSLSGVGLADYVHTNKLTIPILTGLSSETIKAYKLGGTPQTLVISPEGRVVQNWRGAWTNNQKSDIETFFHVNLPGIQLSSLEH
jgi:peroxiredoxin